MNDISVIEDIDNNSMYEVPMICVHLDISDEANNRFKEIFERQTEC